MKALPRHIVILALAIGVVGSALAGVLSGLAAALAFGLGAVLGTGNFAATRYVGRRALDVKAGKIRAPWAALFVVKFLVFGLSIYLGVAVAALEVIPFVLGISVVLVSIFIASLRMTPLRPEPLNDWS